MTLVYRFRVFDITTNQYVTSSRWATPLRIASLGGETVGEGVETDDKFMDPDVTGMCLYRHDPSAAPPRARVRTDAAGRDLDAPFISGPDYAGEARQQRDQRRREHREGRQEPVAVAAGPAPETAAP